MREDSGSIAAEYSLGEGVVLVLSELQTMAARQQREIAQQRHLLEQRETRLNILQGIQEPIHQERLTRLRHRLDQQQSKLNKLRLLRSQTDQLRVNNATLTSDLDCIRALFNEKEKELSLAVAKVEELTRQLEDLRGRNNRNFDGDIGQIPPTASIELEKLRKELMFRNRMNEQQNQMVSQQRMVLAQRQAEMISIDSRIAQLQGRLQRKRALNQRLLNQQFTNNRQLLITTTSATITTTSITFASTSASSTSTTTTTIANNSNINPSILGQGIKQESVNELKIRPTGNIAAIEPYNHIPTNNDFNLNKYDPKYQTLPYNTKFQINYKSIDDDINKNKIKYPQSISQTGQQKSMMQQLEFMAQNNSQQIYQDQSINQLSSRQSPASIPQQHSLQNFSTPMENHQVNNNNIINDNDNDNNNKSNNNVSDNNDNENDSNNNSSNNNINNDNDSDDNNNINHNHNHTTSNINNINSNNNIQNQQNSYAVGGINENLNQQQNSRIYNYQQSYPIQNSIKQSYHTAKVDLLSSNSCSENQEIIKLNGIQKNHQLQQKPISSVAPSFTIKSPIYQTSSTKIHPVLPQTLSLINRGHSYSDQQQQQQQQQINQTSQDSALTNDNTDVRQGQSIQNLKNTSYDKVDNSNPLSSYNEIYNVKSITQDILNDVAKSINSKKQDKYGHVKYETNSVTKHDYPISTMIDNKFDQISGNHHKFEISNKLDNISKLDYNDIPVNSQFQHHDTLNSQQSKQDNPLEYEYNQSSLKYDHEVKHDINFKMLEKSQEFYEKSVESDKKPINFENTNESKKKPTLPPKPVKPNLPPRLNTQNIFETSLYNKITNEEKSNIIKRGEKKEETNNETLESTNEINVKNQQIIKSRPLILKKDLLNEQTRFRYSKSNINVSINRRIEMPPAFLFPETEIPADLIQTEQQKNQHTVQNINDVVDHNPKIISDEEIDNDKLKDSDIVEALNVINMEDKLKRDTDKKLNIDITDSKSLEIIKKKKGNLKSTTTSKINLSRRVSFDPLALLLDASLEGELELVKKTAKEVANPSSANDEGITALHNAICAGHLEIVKFLVEFGCDVNAQDSDGWTPLHCAASCNNLAMVKFLVEHGACIFATTLSDHETAAEKCEEDEEGFDGCSEYLYSVQEKLGIMNNGQVFAVFDYDAQHNDELSLKNGDQLIILRKGDDNEREWWWSKLGHKEGYVPRNLLGLYPRAQPVQIDE